MSQFGMPDPHDNVSEERIESSHIKAYLIGNADVVVAYWKRGSSTNKTENEAPRRIKLFVFTNMSDESVFVTLITPNY